jgi:mycothione reductase
VTHQLYYNIIIYVYISWHARVVKVFLILPVYADRYFSMILGRQILFLTLIYRDTCISLHKKESLMKKFDLIVIGSGSGMKVVWSAAKAGLNVALVEGGPLGGTCLNNGCIPSKIMIYPADVISAANDAKNVGIDLSVDKVDMGHIMRRVGAIIDRGRRQTARDIQSTKNLTWLMGTGEFTGDYTLKVDVDTITAPKIVIATGARPRIPPIDGLEETGYLDNVSLMNIKKLPESITIIGAGYIGCEFGHFFSALGTRVTMIGRHPRMLAREDPEISAVVTRVLSRDLTYRPDSVAVKAERRGDKKVVSARNLKTGRVEQIESDEIMIATGRLSNADVLKPENTGVETDRKGWIKVNKYLETGKPGIYALGDAIDGYMFKHTANYEADIISDNLLRGKRRENDTHAVPHAVYTHPQIGSVGMTEAQALKAGRKILVGRARFIDSAKGYAMAEEDGLMKVVVEEGTNRILGFSAVGPDAPLLAQQVVFLMNTDSQDLTPFWRSQVIHPILTEVLANALANLEKPEMVLA